MAFPLQIVDLAIQRSDIDQLIGFYRSDRRAMNHINQNLNELAAALGVNFINSFNEIVIAYHKAVIDQMKALLRWPPDGYVNLYLYAYRTGYSEVVRYVESIVKFSLAGENPNTPWEIAVGYRNCDLLKFLVKDPLASGLIHGTRSASGLTYGAWVDCHLLNKCIMIAKECQDEDLEEKIKAIASVNKCNLSTGSNVIYSSDLLDIDEDSSYEDFSYEDMD
ncbi:Hypothetical protein POVR1_LOCUS525 [uncultured virus]|nr:Hypothetical protein POVR1_LOCUS525 [uncultured virus]